MTEPCLCWRSFHYLGPRRAFCRLPLVCPWHVEPCQRAWLIYHQHQCCLTDAPVFSCVSSWGPLLIDWSNFSAYSRGCLLVMYVCKGSPTFRQQSIQTLNFRLTTFNSSASSESICAVLFTCKIFKMNYLKKNITVNHSLCANALRWKGGTDTKQCCWFLKIIRFLLFCFFLLLLLHISGV